MNNSSSLSLLSGGIIYAILCILALLMIFPFVYVIAVSFTDQSVYVPGKLILFPEKWSLDSYRYILASKSIGNAYKSTVFITVVGTLLNLLFTASFAYAISRKELPGRNLMITMVLITMLFGPGMIPHYLLVSSLGLINSLWALILPGLAGAWSIFVFKSFYNGIPDSLQEASIIDGCTEFQTWYKIVLPLSLPVIAAFTLFFAVGHWNVYFAALIYLNDYKKWTLQVILQQMIIQNDVTSMAGDFQDSTENRLPSETIKMAALIVVILPILALYPFLQRFFVKGVLIGSVKG